MKHDIMLYSVRTHYLWGAIPTQEINQIRKWLYCFVGEPYIHWATTSDNGILIVKFTEKKDALKFALRWS